MSNRRTNKEFYNIYPKYFRDFSREYIKKHPVCEMADGTCKGNLTLAHLDQNPQNNDLSNLKVLCTSHHIRYDQPFHIFSMSTSTKKTDNSYIAEKVQLRLETVEKIEKDSINILEAYAGDGVIWREVQKHTNKKLNILKIEVKDNKKGVYLKGNNEKFFPLFNFENYDIIDLDAYGIPFNQLEVVFLKEFKGFVHVTYIQSGMGRLPNGLLIKLGYTKEMINKCSTLFSKNGLEKIMQYLSINKVDKITGFFINRKNYFYFKIN